MHKRQLVSLVRYCTAKLNITTYTCFMSRVINFKATATTIKELRSEMNDTTSICSSRLTYISIAYIIPRYVVTSVGILSNIILVIGLIRDPLKCFRNSSSYLIMNLAISDILTNLSWYLFQYWHPCINGFSLHPLIYLPPYVGGLSIATMAFDRYMSCVHPFKYRIQITRNLTLAIISLQWLLSLVLLAFQIISVKDRWHVYARSGIGFFVLLGAALMYGKAAYVLKNNSRYLKSVAAVSTTVQNKAQHARLVNEKRLLTTMFLVSFLTITTLTPLMIYMIAIYDSYTRMGSNPVHVWLTTLFFVNFSINPFIYVWRLKNYRTTVKMLLTN